MRVEAAVISDIQLAKDYPFVRIVYFKHRKYRVIVASNTNFEVGDTVLFIPGDAVLPEWLLKKFNFWDYKNNCGLLGGKKNDVVCPFNYAGNSSYFSYGMFVIPENGMIITPSGKQVSITDEDIDTRLGITYLRKGIPYYFNGDLFYMDIPVNKNSAPDLETNYFEFENESVVLYEEYIPGRNFYVVIDRRKAHHMAVGDDHNIFITAPEFSKYTFLCQTKRNTKGNLYVKSIVSTGLDKDITNYLRRNTKFSKLIIEFRLKSTAFGGNKKELIPKRNLLIVTDVYVNDFPFGKFLSVNERNYFAKNLELLTPKLVKYDEFSFDTAVQLGKENGIVVRSEDGKKRGVFHTYKDRLRRKHILH